MLTALREISDLFRIAGVGGVRRLIAHSRHLQAYGRPAGIMNCLLALETCGLNRLLLSDAGLDVTEHRGLDSSVLSTICEYLYETGLLARPAPQRYVARDRRRFRAVLEAMFACGAYHEPTQALPHLLTGRYRYGLDVSRDERYEAIASSTLVSLFSFGFSLRLLRAAVPRSILDLGCGTGEYLAFLAQRGLQGPLYGLDLSKDAIAEGRQRGFETGEVKLLVGDLFELPAVVRTHGLPPVDVVSFMFVLHEFEAAQISTALHVLKDTFPRSHVLLTELIGESSDEVARRRRTAFPELKFVHQLSGQTLRSPADWQRIFAEAGFRVSRQAVHRLTSHVCFLLAPR